MDEAAKSRSVADFERQIYPIWKGIEEKDRHDEEKMTSAQVSLLDVMLEVSTLHRQDRAIRSSGIMPGTMTATREGAEALRKKAAASERFGSWKG
jgi:hypothetical protein